MRTCTQTHSGAAMGTTPAPQTSGWSKAWGGDTGTYLSPSGPSVPSISDATRPTPMSVRNPHPASVHAPQQGQGGAAPTLPPLREPQRPNHTPFLLGLACLGSGSCSQNRRPSQARGEALDGRGGGRSPQSDCPLPKEGPQTSGCAPGPSTLDPLAQSWPRCPQRSPLPAPPHPYPPPPEAVTGAGLEGGQGAAPSPDRPGPLG